MSALDDPRYPTRPDHPDFWRLSEIILQLDGQFAEAKDDEEREAVRLTAVTEAIDIDSLVYMALQRAYRVVEAETGEHVLARLDEIADLVSNYIEAFVVGVRFAGRGGKQ